MQIFPIKESHIREITQISNNLFGKGFITSEYVKNHIDSHKKKGFVAITKDNKIAAYILIEFINQKKISQIILKEKDWFKYYFQDYVTLTLIKHIAVNYSFQNKGIATSLINHIQNKTICSSDIICCLAWVKKNKTSLKNVLIKNNFLFIRKINNYWFNDSINKKYYCSFCGFPPCKCSVEVHIKRKPSI
jgi:hypothetical protein